MVRLLSAPVTPACDLPPPARCRPPSALPFPRPPGRAGLLAQNFCRILDFYTTYRCRETSYRKARPPAEAAQKRQSVVGWSTAVQTKPIGRRGTIMPNKPNRPSGGIPAIPRFQHSSPMSAVRNKPNFHHSADREIGAAGGLSCETKPTGGSR
jgi:hypothetical protein